jgi:glycosyltransferase involved in cell wall biosynthesis
MIPTYNCARYLRQTLTSVLAQAPGPDQMQIEVVDDGSTVDDPAAVVRQWGQGRVAFHRNSQNQGVTKNFNVCLQRSRGHLVHILHGDDYVLPGFYQRIKAAAEKYPSAALLATRSFDIDADNVILHVAPRLRDLETAAHAVESFFYTTPIQTPGVVMRRDFYEQHGGFDLRLAHTADCEMWARAIGLASGCITPEVLACYRTFPGNDSGHLARTAGNLHDIERLNQIFAARYPAFDSKKAARRVWHTARQQIRHFNRQGDAPALAANLLYWQTQVPWAFRLRNFFRIKTNR